MPHTLFLRVARWVDLLDYLHYREEEALSVFKAEFGYELYPDKHYESVFTRFYQGYILPRKFGVDKRLLHLSTLVFNGQLKGTNALRLLDCPPYPDAASTEKDRRYFLKMMGWSEAQLEEYLVRPAIPRDSYGSSYRLINAIRGRSC